MDRSLYPEGVEVHQRHLENTETTKAAAIKRLTTDATSRGVVSGLGVTVNAVTNTRIDVAAGTGYVANGDYVNLTVAKTNLALADYTLGAKNYVLLMYDEVQSSPEAHETDGTTRNTKATNSPRVVILTESAYNALPQTDAILANNAKDRSLLLAIVTANGVGVALTASSIVGTSVFRTVLNSSQPVNISGVKVLQVDSFTAVGNGTLSFTAATKVITWAAPGDTAGAGVTLTTSQSYTLASANGRTLVIDVVFSQLPSTNQTDTIVITDIYTQTAPRFTAIDAQHRSQLGSGIPTPNNPHGLTLDDLSPGASGSLEEHIDIMHSDGITSISSNSLLAATVNTITSPDQLLLTNFATGNDLIFVNGVRVSSVHPSSSTTVTFSDGVANAAVYGIYIDQDGVISKQVRCQYPSSSFLSDKLQIFNVSDDIGTESKNLTWKSTGKISFDGGPEKDAPAADTALRLYSSNHRSYVDVYVKGSATPGSNQTDLINFLVEPSREEKFPLHYVFWSGSATGFLGYGFGSGNSPNKTFDRRTFGNITEVDLRNDIGFISPKALVNEIMLGKDGLYMRDEVLNSAIGANINHADEDWQVSSSALTVTINGGVCYVGGKRLSLASASFTATNNTVHRYYISTAGVITQGGAGVAWSSLTDVAIKLWEVYFSSGAEVGRIDYRYFIGEQSLKTNALYVIPTSGTKNWRGTNTGHFRSLEAAIDFINTTNLTPRTIILAQGTHLITNSITGLTLPRGVSLIGEVSDTEASTTPILKSMSNMVSGAAYLVCEGNNYIRGIRFGAPSTVTPQASYSLSIIGDNVHIDQCQFFDGTIKTGAIRVSTGSNLLVTQCIFGTPTTGLGTAVLEFFNSGGVSRRGFVLRDCVSYGSDDGGQLFRSYSGVNVYDVAAYNCAAPAVGTIPPFSDNSAPHSVLVLDGCRFEYKTAISSNSTNTVLYDGGVTLSYRGIYISNCYFRNTVANNTLVRLSQSFSTHFVNCSFVTNASVFNLYYYSGSWVKVANCQVVESTTSTVLFTNNATNVEFENCQFGVSGGPHWPSATACIDNIATVILRFNNCSFYNVNQMYHTASLTGPVYNLEFNNCRWYKATGGTQDILFMYTANTNTNDSLVLNNCHIDHDGPILFVSGSTGESNIRISNCVLFVNTVNTINAMLTIQSKNVKTFDLLNSKLYVKNCQSSNASGIYIHADNASGDAQYQAHYNIDGCEFDAGLTSMTNPMIWLNTTGSSTRLHITSQSCSFVRNTYPDSPTVWYPVRFENANNGVKISFFLFNTIHQSGENARDNNSVISGSPTGMSGVEFKYAAINARALLKVE
jgi:hypothetical protein